MTTTSQVALRWPRPLALWLALAALGACDGSRASTPGGRGPVSGSSTPRDSGLPGQDAGASLDVGWADFGVQPFDANPPSSDAGFVFPDAAEIGTDRGFTFLDAAAPDSGFWRDGGFTFPDASPPPDGGFRWDAGFRDSGAGGDGGVTGQTNVALQLGSSTVTLDARPGAPADALDFQATLEYQNAGPGPELIQVVGASLSLILASHTFAVGPDHLAPVGSSTEVVRKIPGSGSGIAVPASILCGLPLPLPVTLELSNGQVIQDTAIVQCLQ